MDLGGYERFVEAWSGWKSVMRWSLYYTVGQGQCLVRGSWL